MQFPDLCFGPVVLRQTYRESTGREKVRPCFYSENFLTHHEQEER